jgi:hypothetical protein
MTGGKANSLSAHSPTRGTRANLALCRVRVRWKSVLLDRQPSLLTLRQRCSVFNVSSSSGSIRRERARSPVHCHRAREGLPVLQESSGTLRRRRRGIDLWPHPADVKAAREHILSRAAYLASRRKADALSRRLGQNGRMILPFLSSQPTRFSCSVSRVDL